MWVFTNTESMHKALLFSMKPMPPILQAILMMPSPPSKTFAGNSVSEARASEPAASFSRYQPDRQRRSARHAGPRQGPQDGPRRPAKGRPGRGPAPGRQGTGHGLHSAVNPHPGLFRYWHAATGRPDHRTEFR